ncbi:CynX/NimT family MFS transporter [Chitiniphilus eburneus]|uniref:CynX/NimT family MFS transporter n=1 Tax=Chitiniphilus eburneus TaxID=2571148 RepID=A0A4U0PXK6_9NEIS|nr:CynX/NimT family MFS transporter [Chitiniphilus eburneus]TJZ73323.1 CynX/NimT family MFS transporter [Chitiniphilus eburneus]
MTQPLHDLPQPIVDAEIDDVPPPHPPAFNPVLLVAGMILVGLNLRPALSSVAPILGALRADTGLGATAAGLLTTLPVLCLGLAAPLAPRMARRWGAERTAFGILLLLAAGLLLRTVLGPSVLFVGTAIAGASIGIIGVLLPGIVKRDFPHHPGTMTGLYTMALCLGAAMAAGATEPLRLAFDSRWQPALAFWAIPAVIAALAWLPQLRRADHGHHRQGYTVTGLWRDPLAWQVTIYMGLQSSLAYCVFGWLPSILVDRGLTPVQAGWVMSVSVLLQLITALGGPWAATRARDQRGAIAVMLVLTWAGLLGCLFAPLSQLWPWAIVLGLGQGGTFSIALTLIVLRARDPHVAAHLSGMSQGVGYTLAALGPFAVGVIHDLSGSWAPLGVFFTILSVAALIAGLGAGRKRYVGARTIELPPAGPSGS